MKEITVEEREQFFLFWTTQKQAIKDRVSEETFRWVNTYTEIDNIGYGFGQLGPGKIGQWDLFFKLTGPQSQNICGENEAMIACGLTAAEVAEERRREYYRQHCVDPDVILEIENFERTQRMTSEELDAEIERLEKKLAKI